MTYQNTSTHPGFLRVARDEASKALAFARSNHKPFILLPSITVTAHTLADDPYKTVLDKSTYDALGANKPRICELPTTGLLLELSVLWKSDKTGSTGLTTAPVVRVFGIHDIPDTGPGSSLNLAALEDGNSPIFSANEEPLDKGYFQPLVTTNPTTPSVLATMSTTNGWKHSNGSDASWGLTQPVTVFLAGASRITATLGTAAVVDATSVSSAHLIARVIDA